MLILFNTMQCNFLASNLNIMWLNSISPNCHEQGSKGAGLFPEMFSASARGGYLLAPESVSGQKGVFALFLLVYSHFRQDAPSRMSHMASCPMGVLSEPSFFSEPGQFL